MHCPFCQHEDTRVIDSRLADDGATVRRRRECPQCGERFNTFETAELKLPAIVKSGERRENFDEHKLRISFERALQKRPVASHDVDSAVREIVNDLRRSGEREVPARHIGELVMRELKKLDQVAYVRFASVYRKFEDVHAFREEIEKLERDLPPGLENMQLSLLGEAAAAAAVKRNHRKG
ncbi:transcriptional regulator NrdR [Dyella acidiphila]|uniref:Transcriptional repressor NrdR n=1 Tax=Dyella acidiphila TaxID=2775866 RepID=A0ABR9G4C1_9GAMM|nr:transcriptional regulator NrdR [Dyella acidiphila]MBE1158870.1 transcriptional repressor NrdR [Dyella acidiphila]